MPLVRFEVKNEYGLADPELYSAEAKEEDPRAILDGVTVAGLVGILRQLGDLAEFAADIFRDLHEQVTITAARGRKMLTQIQRIESALPSLEKVIQGQRSHIHFAYIAGSDWHANVRTGQNQLLCSDLPQFMIDCYEECRDPPRLYLLDRFDNSGAGACLKRYSDPSYFSRALASSEPVKAEKVKRKRKKKGSRLRNGGIQHALFTSRESNSTQFASPSTDHLSFSGENVSLSDTRSKYELERESIHFDLETRSNCFEQVSDTPCVVPGEPEYGGFSASESNPGNPAASVLHNGPKQDIADDDSQAESLQQRSAPSTSSVTWDEKAEIVKPTGASQVVAGAKRVQDLDSLPQIFETSNLGNETAKVGIVNEEDIVFELAKEPVSYTGGILFDEIPTETNNFAPVSCLGVNLFDEVHMETDNFTGTTNILEPDIESVSEVQTKQVLKSPNLTCGDLESRSCRLNEISATNSACFDAQVPIISCGSLNNIVLSDGIGHVRSTNTAGHIPDSDSSVGSGHSKSHIPCEPEVSVSDLQDGETVSEVQTKQELKSPNLNCGDLESRSCRLNKISATNSACFDAQVPIISCSSLNNFVLSDGIDHVRSTNSTGHIPDSDSSVGNGHPKSHIPCVPGISVSDLQDGELFPVSSIANEQDLLVNNGTTDETSKSEDCPANASNLRSVRIWTNGGILGVEPSKPPDFSINANPEATAMCNGSKARSTLPVKEGDKSDGDLLVMENSQDSIQGPSLADLGKNQEAPSSKTDSYISGLVHIETSDVTASGSDLSGICNTISHSRGSDKNLTGFSTSFSGLAHKFLSNNLQRRILVAHAGLSTPSQLVNADFRKLQEILLQNDHKELPKRVVPNALCKPETEENIEVGSLRNPVSSTSLHFGSSSPPLEHMKISFHSMNGLDTSKLKLEFSNGSFHEDNGDFVFPSFQLIPGPSNTMHDSDSGSDDDTFCRSSAYSSDDLLSPHSESNSELWGEDERSESQKHRVSDDSCRNSSTTTSICSSTKFYQMNRSSVAYELEHTEVENCRISDSIADFPSINSVIYESQQKEICEPQPSNFIDSTSRSPNELPPPPPLPPLQWRMVKQSDSSVEDKNATGMKVTEHLDAESQCFATHKVQEQVGPRSPCNAEALAHPIKKTDLRMPTGNGLNHNFSIKEQNAREDLLHQIRSKSFNLRCGVTTKTSHILVPVTNANAMEKAHII